MKLGTKVKPLVTTQDNFGVFHPIGEEARVVANHNTHKVQIEFHHDCPLKRGRATVKETEVCLTPVSLLARLTT